jgi:hypothetical protein
MKNTVKTILHLTTQLHWLYDTNKTIYENRQQLSTIKYKNESYNKNQFGQHLMSVANELIIIKACSFLDEYNKGLAPLNYPEYSDRIKLIKTILKPATKRINKWSDLRNYRNDIIAHNLKKGTDYILNDNNKVEYNIPHTDNEMFLLCELIFMMTREIHNQFLEIVKSLNHHEKISDHLVIDKKNIDVLSEMLKVRNEIENIKLSQ